MSGVWLKQVISCSKFKCLGQKVGSSLATIRRVGEEEGGEGGGGEEREREGGGSHHACYAPYI